MNRKHVEADSGYKAAGRRNLSISDAAPNTKRPFLRFFDPGSGPTVRADHRQIPGVATTVVSGAIAFAILVALAKYGTGALLAPDNSVVFPEKAFQAFLVAGTIGGFLVCICYALVALGALAKFATKRPIDLIAALIGLATCVLGIAAQFVEGTAPTGDGKWGIWLGLVGLGACVVWIAVSKRENLEKAGNHALQHAH